MSKGGKGSSVSESSGAVEEIAPVVFYQSQYPTRIDGYLFRFRLREDAVWSDGVPVTAEELNGRAADLFAAWRTGKLAVTVDREVPLAEAADAHRYLEAGKTKGKLLLRI